MLIGRKVICAAVSRWAGVGTLLALAGVSVVVTFGPAQGWVQMGWFRVMAWGLLGLFAGMTLWALARRRWVSALFHGGALAVVVGGALTAGYAKQWEMWLVDSPYAPVMDRQRMIQGERVALARFEVENYPNGQPKQYRTTLQFPEGSREISVNKPLRRKGLVYYQMSYTPVEGPYGERVWATMILVRQDRGWPVVFAGYGMLVAAAVLMALREEGLGRRSDGA
ncbi:MAG: cytochrome c biogenesis protein ResB [Candidatus Spyradenecus sp.]